MDDTRRQNLLEFTAYARKLKGDEKGEAQVYLDRLFRAFGQHGVAEAGATLEMRVRNDGGGTAFADLVWKPIVLIEMKKRGEDLSRHLAQAFNYWVRLVPNRPRWVVLCNFDEFRIYDFDADLNEPQDTVTLDELPDRYDPLAFLFPMREEPRFRVNRLKVTREAADLLAAVYSRLARRKDVGPPLAQRFILQMLVALFSEDIGLLPRHFVTQLLDDCVDPPTAFDLLGGLFRAMNTRAGAPGARGGRFKDVPYFNGGLFSEPAPVELAADEQRRLRKAADYNWAHIAPDIFGTIFQHSMDGQERHAFGAHYTAPTDIMKIVGPTIVQPWRTAIEQARSVEALRRLQQRLYTFRVLDPACGSGNFLYLAYRELKRIEKELLDRLREVAPKEMGRQREFGFVTSRQFYGMDILSFAVELAKVTMTLAHKLAIDELHVEEQALPLDNLDANILCKDALIDAGGTPAAWPAADVIIGNPPFLGAKRLKPERGADYVNAVRAAYPDVPGMADYCVYWFRRAHDHLPVCTPEDPFAGRAGLVGTQNIRNNQSRVGGLDHIVKSGVIVEAVENQPWSGEANVHVSIANWVKTPHAKASEPALLVPSPRKLWFKIDPKLALFEDEAAPKRPKVVTTGKRGKVRQDKSYEMVVRDCAEINSALSDEADVGTARALSVNSKPQRAFRGLEPGNMGFLVPESTAKKWIAQSSSTAKVLRPFLMGQDLVTGDGMPDRWVIDFQRMDQLEARAFAQPFAHVEQHVLEQMQQIAGSAGGQRGDAEFTKRVKSRNLVARLDNWWQLRRNVPATVTTL